MVIGLPKRGTERLSHQFLGLPARDRGLVSVFHIHEVEYKNSGDQETSLYFLHPARYVGQGSCCQW